MSLESRASGQSTDYFLEHRPYRSKDELADYVESEGVLVPPRYKSLEAAVDLDEDFIARTQLPQDYDGISGIGTSPRYDTQPARQRLRGMTSREFEAIQRKSFIERSDTRHFCELLGVTPEAFFADLTYSYWQLLPGHNRSVIEDNAIPGRYHIFSTFPSRGLMDFFNYTLVDQGKIIYSVPEVDSHIFPFDNEVIEFYKRVKDLPRFAPQHCPIIEMQSVEGRQYFLQYLRANDSLPAGFVLEREPEADEIEVAFVRGATPPEGVILPTTFWFDHERVNPDEKAGYEYPGVGAFPDIMAGRRQIQIVFGFEDWDAIDSIAVRTVAHQGKSVLLKPKMSVVIPQQEIEEKIFRGRMKELQGHHYPYTVPIRYISDGRRAYLKVLDR